MIPKTIHWIWLSDEPCSLLIQECMKSWKILEDNGYIIKKWTRHDFDVNSHPFVKRMYDQGLYAFASDYIRLWVLYNYGGIYLDSDIEVLKPFSEEMLDKPYMFGMKSEREHLVAGYIMGCEKGSEIMKELLEYYDKYVTEPIIMELLISNIIIEMTHATVYPSTYFTPRDEEACKNAYTIHHFTANYSKLLHKYRKEHNII